jgi:hypothetical protein
LFGVGPDCPVFTEWCRPPWGSPVPNAGQWSGYSPAGCEVCREPARRELRLGQWKNPWSLSVPQHSRQSRRGLAKGKLAGEHGATASLDSRSLLTAKGAHAEMASAARPMVVLMPKTAWRRIDQSQLTKRPSCEAGHMTCTRPHAARQIPLAMRASSTHDPSFA